MECDPADLAKATTPDPARRSKIRQDGVVPAQALPVRRRLVVGSHDMTRWAIWTLAAAALATTVSVQSLAQTSRESTWSARTPWGDPDLQGEWTTEGEYGVPLERPAQFG